jgi:hypothetical protein
MTDEPRILTVEQLVDGFTSPQHLGGPLLLDGHYEPLRERVLAHTERLICEQLEALGVEITEESINNHCKKVMYPDDPHHLCDYYYNDILILRVKENISGLGLDFQMPPVGK